MKKKLVFIFYFMVQGAFAQSIVIDINTVVDHKKIGTITLKDTPYGLLITPNLHSVKPGLHGLHIHQNLSCEKLGMAAGAHYSPMKTAKHAGPYQKGHLGELPFLYVDPAGKAKQAILAPRLHLKDIMSRSIMLHEGGDNYSDNPLPLGGGGARLACGLLKNRSIS